MSSSVTSAAPVRRRVLAPRPESARTSNTTEALSDLLVDTPWTARDLTALAMRAGLGLSVIVAGWVGASATATQRDQVIWIGVGLGGLLIASLAGVGWLLQGFGALGRDRRAARSAIAARLARRAAASTGRAGEGQLAVLVAAPLMRYFHRPSCDAVHGKDVQQVTVADCVSRDLRPCRMCRP